LNYACSNPHSALQFKTFYISFPHPAIFLEGTGACF
jgi:hypothetical protein